MKKLLPFLFFVVLLCSFASAEINISNETTYTPPNSNVTYNMPTGGITCDAVFLNDTCLIITNGTYDGEYCYILQNPRNFTLGNVIYEIGICNATTTNNVLNFRFFDETTDLEINATAGYSLSFTFNNTVVNTTNTVTDVENASMCTNVAKTYSLTPFNFYGSLTLAKTDYVTRTYDFSDDPKTNLTINETLNQSLFLIPINDSTTITFTWLTTQFQLIDGTMLIYKCNINGSQELVESIPVVSGEAIANLQLLEQQYSYEIIIEGETYTDDSFTTCHVESSSARTFYINLIEIDVAPAIGLLTIDCVITKVGNNTVNMQWTDNPEDDSAIEGCILAYREDLYNLTQIYKNCTNLTNSMTRTIASDGNTYYVRGTVNQSGNLGFCRNEVTFFNNLNAAELFGSVAVFAIFLLILSLYLIYASEGTVSMAAGSVGVIIAFFLGILNLPWTWVLSVIFFGIFVVVVGRYAKR